MANSTCFYNDNNIHQYQVTDQSGSVRTMADITSFAEPFLPTTGSRPGVNWPWFHWDGYVHFLLEDNWLCLLEDWNWQWEWEGNCEQILFLFEKKKRCDFFGNQNLSMMSLCITWSEHHDTDSDGKHPQQYCRRSHFGIGV